jgi:hypothetical protein
MCHLVPMNVTDQDPLEPALLLLAINSETQKIQTKKSYTVDSETFPIHEKYKLREKAEPDLRFTSAFSLPKNFRGRLRNSIFFSFTNGTAKRHSTCQCCGSRSGSAFILSSWIRIQKGKMSHKSEEISSFEVLNVLFEG